ncbi:unnamed protein product [Gongylonema pulchrum]|uniref:Protein kinase domain-containing protein n=1 Tax=Gongylonema pulchrum TaxID=637853 RepID=A0A183D6P5_9BILA|nr:unnamed protein product [Gongylonema pulchrum]
MLGSGGFGDVYKAQKVGTEEFYAIKTQYHDASSRRADRLKIEASVMNAINNFEDASRKNHLITLIDQGKTDQFQFIVMQLLGPSISDLRRYFICSEFSRSTAMRVSQQTLQGIWDLHVIGYLHKDIKPQNFAIGLNDKAHVVYLIDLGMARKYIDQQTKKIK